MNALDKAGSNVTSDLTQEQTFRQGQDSSSGTPQSVAFHYCQTEHFAPLLEHLGISLLVSTYQANKLLTVRSAGGGLSTLVRTFDRPMGIAADSSRLAVGTRREIWLLRNAPDIASRIDPAGTHDACYLPRLSHVTGDIGVHEVAWSGDELWVVSTRFSCLCTLDPDYSFVPRWQPRFISELAAEDRCHLNGLAMIDCRPGFASALGMTDSRDGWRANKAHGGCLVDVSSGETIAGGLSMPHSPRWHKDRIWVLESGTGSLLQGDRATGHLEPFTRLPGFARGLAIVEPYAFIGLSKIRPSSAMDAVPLARRRSELKCGVAVVDLGSAEVVAMLEFQTAVQEVFDVQVLAGSRFPELVGFQKATMDHTFVIPKDRACFDGMPG